MHVPGLVLGRLKRVASAPNYLGLPRQQLTYLAAGACLINKLL